MSDRNPNGGAFGLMLLAFVPIGLLNGWAVSLLWGWFAVPPFGLPRLSVPEAWGLSMLVTFLVVDLRIKSDGGWEEGVRLVVTSAVLSVTAVGYGFLLASVMGVS